MKRIQGPEKTHDVHMKVGFWFIGGCLLIGLVVGGLIPVLADTLGVLHMSDDKAHLKHIGFQEAAMYAVIGGIFGAWNGVLLSINRSLWLAGFLLALVPCGFFGGCAASATPRPYAHAPNAIVYLLVPVLVTAGCLALRREVWNRYQKPVIRPSNRA